MNELNIFSKANQKKIEYLLNFWLEVFLTEAKKKKKKEMINRYDWTIKRLCVKGFLKGDLNQRKKC